MDAAKISKIVQKYNGRMPLKSYTHMGDELKECGIEGICFGKDYNLADGSIKSVSELQDIHGLGTGIYFVCITYEGDFTNEYTQYIT